MSWLPVVVVALLLGLATPAVGQWPVWRQVVSYSSPNCTGPSVAQYGQPVPVINCTNVACHVAPSAPPPSSCAGGNVTACIVELTSNPATCLGGNVSRCWEDLAVLNATCGGCIVDDPADNSTCLGGNLTACLAALNASDPSTCFGGNVTACLQLLYPGLTPPALFAVPGSWQIITCSSQYLPEVELTTRFYRSGPGDGTCISPDRGSFTLGMGFPQGCQAVASALPASELTVRGLQATCYTNTSIVWGYPAANCSGTRVALVTVNINVTKTSYPACYRDKTDNQTFWFVTCPAIVAWDGSN